MHSLDVLWLLGIVERGSFVPPSGIFWALKELAWKFCQFVEYDFLSCLVSKGRSYTVFQLSCCCVTNHLKSQWLIPTTFICSPSCNQAGISWVVLLLVLLVFTHVDAIFWQLGWGGAVQDGLITRLVFSQGCQPGCLSFLSCCLSSRISWVSNMVQQCSERRMPQCISTYQTLSCIMFADVPLTKARAMAEPRIDMGGNSTGCASWRPWCHNPPQTTWSLRSFQLQRSMCSHFF